MGTPGFPGALGSGKPRPGRQARGEHRMSRQPLGPSPLAYRRPPHRQRDPRIREVRRRFRRTGATGRRTASGGLPQGLPRPLAATFCALPRPGAGAGAGAVQLRRTDQQRPSADRRSIDLLGPSPAGGISRNATFHESVSKRFGRTVAAITSAIRSRPTPASDFGLATSLQGQLHWPVWRACCDRCSGRAGCLGCIP